LVILILIFGTNHFFLALINIQFKHHHENPDGTFGPQVESHGVLSVLILKLPYTQIEQVCLVEQE